MSCLLLVVSSPVEIMEATRRGMSVSDEDFEKWKRGRPNFAPFWTWQILQKRLQRIASYNPGSEAFWVSCGKTVKQIDLASKNGLVRHPTAWGVSCLEKAWTKIPSVEIRKNVSKMREIFRELQRRGYEFDGVKRAWDEEIVKGVHER
jgi:hypothetical protein